MSLFFASAEDTIPAKLESYKKGGCVSDRQWRDVVGVLKVQSSALDRSYLREWALALEIAELLDRAFQESGLITDRLKNVPCSDYKWPRVAARSTPHVQSSRHGLFYPTNREVEGCRMNGIALKDETPEAARSQAG